MINFVALSAKNKQKQIPISRLAVNFKRLIPVQFTFYYND